MTPIVEKQKISGGGPPTSADTSADITTTTTTSSGQMQKLKGKIQQGTKQVAASASQRMRIIGSLATSALAFCSLVRLLTTKQGAFLGRSGPVGSIGQSEVVGFARDEGRALSKDGDGGFSVFPHQNGTTSGKWMCCVDPSNVNDLHNHPAAEDVQDKTHNYACPGKPSNFSWFYSKPRTLVRNKWRKKTILFVGGSTSRQMIEQFRWEMPWAAHQSKMILARFLFDHVEVGGCCNYDRSHILDLRRLHPELVSNMTQGPDYVIFNVGLWWSTKAIGHVIDKNGVTWNIDGTVNSEWRIVNSTASSGGITKPNITFARLMNRAIEMMLKIKHPKTTLVWRSEGTTDCPPGRSFRASVAPVLKKQQIPILNISHATCNYGAARENYDSEHKGPHLCFPSVALRHWLLEFQDQFLSPAE